MDPAIVGHKVRLPCAGSRAPSLEDSGVRSPYGHIAEDDSILLLCKRKTSPPVFLDVPCLSS